MLLKRSTGGTDVVYDEESTRRRPMGDQSLGQQDTPSGHALHFTKRRVTLRYEERQALPIPESETIAFDLP